MEDTGSAILKCYENYVTTHSTLLPQSVAFQLLFDVRFIGAMLLARDNKVCKKTVLIRFCVLTFGLTL